MDTAFCQTQDILYAGTTSDLAALLKQCPFPADAYLLAEHLPMQVIADQQTRRDLLRFTRVGELNERVDPASYSSGRIFCQEFELRWQRDQGTERTRILYTGPASKWPDLIAQHAGTSLREQVAFSRCQSRSYYLFGEALQEKRLPQMGLEPEEAHQYYAEVRIPRLLSYPRLPELPGRRRVRLIVHEYLEEATGNVQWFRFQDLHRAE